MNMYLAITMLGLALKLAVSFKLFAQFPDRHRNIRAELIVFIAVFMAYSVEQVLLFGPESWAALFGLERVYVIRMYYFFDGLSLITGGYLLMSMFGVRFHKHLAVIVIVFLFVAVGGYYLVLTGSMVDGVRNTAHGVTLSKPAEYVYLGRIIVYICTAAVLIALVRSYQSAKSNHDQIKNVYALAAASIYNISCLIGLYYAIPWLMATRGVLFYVVVILILQRSRFFDIRPVAPITLERNAMREVSRIFRSYASEHSEHRDTMKELEQVLVSYKLEKISGFKEGTGSSLPLVAQSMGVNLSSLYDILKRHGIGKPPRE